MAPPTGVAQFNNGLEFDGTDDYTVNFGNQGILELKTICILLDQRNSWVRRQALSDGVLMLAVTLA